MSYEVFSLLTAAEELMEKVIYRTTYKNLYLFKKTLLETGQLVMAATVPVKLEEMNAVSRDSSVAETEVHLEEIEMAERMASRQTRCCTLI